MRGRLGGIGRIERVGHAYTFNRLLLDAIDLLGGGDAGGLEQRRHDVNHVMELRANATKVLDMAGPGNCHALPSAPEMRGDLLGPFKRSVERPRPWNRKM